MKDLAGASEIPGLDLTVRWLSCGSLAGTSLTLLVFFTASKTGIEFATHLLLGLMFLVQTVVLLLGILIAVIVAALRGRFRLSKIGLLLTVLAVAGLAAQLYIVQYIHVDSTTIP